MSSVQYPGIGDVAAIHLNSATGSGTAVRKTQRELRLNIGDGNKRICRSNA